ncbi:MAG: hypothetical protein LZF86_20011 [Nitrospira sp.]|nr:MAG: hypothetical protein LZF86_20011 [Nitrospira sp.]
MDTQRLSRHTTWTVFLSFFIALGLGACSDVSNAPAPAAGPGPLSILTTTLPDGTVNLTYNITLASSGGTPPYTWSLNTGSPQLPNGLSLNTSDGHITGTPTSATGGSINTEFKLVDSKGVSVLKVLPIRVNLAPVPLTIVTSSLPSGSINQIYGVALGPNGGTTPYTWGLKTGTTPLPSGLSLNPSNGVISGTPTVTSNATHTFTLTDATTSTVEKNISLTINAIPLSIESNSLPQATANQNYSATLTATGGTGSYTWGLAGGSPALPNGLTLNPSTGAISGLPSGTSNQNYTFTVTDQTPPTPQTRSKVLQLIVGAAPPPLVITTSSLPSGSVGSSYNSTLVATGGTGAQTWSVISGTLPNGLTLTPSTGAIIGTPQIGSNGTASITVRVQDSGTPQQSTQKALSITIGLPAAPNITTTSLPAGVFNTGYSQTPSVTGGFGTLVWGITSGGLPPGLNLNPSNGSMSGTPTSTGSFSFTLRVTDSTSQSDDQSLTITITPPSPPTITAFTLSAGTVNQAYTPTQLTATGGAAPLTWTVTPALPGGLTLNPTTGIISGIPTNGNNGVTNHTFRVTDSTHPINQFGERTGTLTINANVTPVAITTTTLPTGIAGQSYIGQLAASGGTIPYTFSVNSGSSLPAGLNINAAGAITGTPTGSGTTSTTFHVQDSTSPNQQSATKALTITINAAPPPLTITTTSLSVGTVGQAYNAQLQGSGGTPAYQWSVSPALPTNLQLDQATGAITGTPAANNSASYTFTLQDAASQSVQKSLTLTINAAPLPLTITTASPLPNGAVGAAYGATGGTPATTVTLAASGGTPPYTWSPTVTPALPAGLTFDALTETISGTPVGPSGTTSHEFTVSDSAAGTTNKTLSLTIAP